MNVRKATMLLILGSIYTVLHKALYALFPSIDSSEGWKTLTGFLWIIATFAIVLFARQWLKELKPQDKRMRVSLISIMVFTGLIIVLQLPWGLMASGSVGYRVVFGISRLCNSLAMLGFLLCLSKLVSRGTELWWSLRSTILAVSLTLLLGLVSAGYFVSFLVTGEEPGAWSFLQPLSVLMFVFMYTSIIWFLVRLRLLKSYNLIKTGNATQ